MSVSRPVLGLFKHAFVIIWSSFVWIGTLITFGCLLLIRLWCRVLWPICCVLWAIWFPSAVGPFLIPGRTQNRSRTLRAIRRVTPNRFGAEMSPPKYLIGDHGNPQWYKIDIFRIGRHHWPLGAVSEKHGKVMETWSDNEGCLIVWNNWKSVTVIYRRAFARFWKVKKRCHKSL